LSNFALQFKKYLTGDWYYKTNFLKDRQMHMVLF